MKILVLNAGSSSLKYKLFDMKKKECLIKGHVDAISLPRCILKLQIGNDKKEIIKKIKVKNHIEAVHLALDTLLQYKIIKSLKEISAVGHRVVHGGEYYNQATFIDNLLIKRVRELGELAPLHNPANLAGILAVKKLLPKVKQVAVFDTAFHQTMPKEAFIYGIPIQLYKKYKIRKYGFHGTSHKYVSEKAAEILGKKEHEMITCHLGNGSSITAIKDGKSINTSMGFTPLDGLIMGTRCGEIDPEIILYLIKKRHFTVEKLDEFLNKQSGLKGLTGHSDLRDVWRDAKKGNKMAQLALKILSFRIAFFIGGYMTMLHGLDCIVFTAGIGENAWYIRKGACDYLNFVGLKLDEEKNKRNETIISAPDSKIMVMVIPTNEELEIAEETMELMRKE